MPNTVASLTSRSDISCLPNISHGYPPGAIIIEWMPAQAKLGDSPTEAALLVDLEKLRASWHCPASLLWPDIRLQGAARRKVACSQPSRISTWLPESKCHRSQPELTDPLF